MRGLPVQVGSAVPVLWVWSRLFESEHPGHSAAVAQLDEHRTFNAGAACSSQVSSTSKQIQDYVLKHTGLKVSCLYIAQVKAKHGLIERECYNKAKSENARVPQCPPEKEKAIEEAFAHFGLIE